MKKFIVIALLVRLFLVQMNVLATKTPTGKPSKQTKTKRFSSKVDNLHKKHHLGRKLANDTDGDDRRFSYFCLNADDDLCLGISPGVFVPSAGLSLQLQPYTRNFYNGTDQTNMRWDIVPNGDLDPQNNVTIMQVGLLRLEAQDPILCVDRRATAVSSPLLLFVCEVLPITNWVFEEATGLLRLGDDPTLCATVTQCVERDDPARSCNAAYDTPVIALTQIVQGANLYTKKCYDQGASYSAFQLAQTFVRELDCVAGCSPELQNNGKCDEICNNPVCAYDKGECVDYSSSPTTQPSTLAPALATTKTSKFPTTLPTNAVPTVWPTAVPSASPSILTHSPSASPSLDPTVVPSGSQTIFHVCKDFKSKGGCCGPKW